MKTLADLRAEKSSSTPVRRPERSMTLCLAPDLVAEAQALTSELSSLPDTPTTDDGDEPTGPPKKMGDPASVEAAKVAGKIRARGAEIRARLAALLEEMAEHEGEIRLRANWTDGEWRRWVNEHPPRDEEVPGHDRDLRVASGVCNADDLIDELGAFVHEWNAESLSVEDWAALIEPSLGSGELAEMASNVVTLYEGRLNFPQWRSALSTNLKRLNDYSSPVSSDSPTSGSTAGSPDG